MYLGAHPGPVSARTIAEVYGVSKDHVMKSLQALGALGIVEATPGRSGGFRLVKDPASLRLGRLVADLEPSVTLAECFSPESTCPLTPSCGLAGALARAQAEFFAALDQSTLDDLLQSTGPQLVQLQYASV